MTNPLLTKLGIKTKEPSFLKNVNTQQLIAKDTIKKNSTPTFNFFTKNRAGKKIRDVADTVSSATISPFTFAFKGRSEAVNKMRSQNIPTNVGSAVLNLATVGAPTTGIGRRAIFSVAKRLIPNTLGKGALLTSAGIVGAGAIAKNPVGTATKLEGAGGSVTNFASNLFMSGYKKDFSSIKKTAKENPFLTSAVVGGGLISLGSGALYGGARLYDAITDDDKNININNDGLTKDDLKKLLKNQTPVDGSEVISENTSENTQPSFLNEPSTGTNNTPVTPVTEDLTTQPQVRKKRKSYKKKKKTPEKLTINIKDSSGKDTYNIGNIYK